MPSFLDSRIDSDAILADIARITCIESPTSDVAGVNRVGEGGGLRYAGDSAVISPWGEVLVEGSEAEGVLIADADPAIVRDARTKFPALADRRPEAYRR